MAQDEKPEPDKPEKPADNPYRLHKKPQRKHRPMAIMLTPEQFAARFGTRHHIRITAKHGRS